MCARDMGRRGAPARAPRPGHAAPPASRVPRARAAQTSGARTPSAETARAVQTRARRTAHGHASPHTRWPVRLVNGTIVIRRVQRVLWAEYSRLGRLGRLSRPTDERAPPQIWLGGLQNSLSQSVSVPEPDRRRSRVRHSTPVSPAAAISLFMILARLIACSASVVWPAALCALAAAFSASSDAATLAR